MSEYNPTLNETTFIKIYSPAREHPLLEYVFVLGKAGSSLNSGYLIVTSALSLKESRKVMI